ncbi:MAG: SAM-dependent chlorinase/fluorinase [Nitrospinae bacterium]|nr:SAM-dependent chlorinase/fluorinase [Nitrospinota bacterium]
MGDIKKLESEVQRLSENIDTLGKHIRQETSNAVKTMVLEQIQKTTGIIDDRIDRRFQTAIRLIGLLLLIFGAFAGVLGYLGIQQGIPSLVVRALGDKAVADFNKMRNEAEAALAEIKETQAVTRANRLIVIQTDYGTKSPYMASLVGVIYSENPNARIQTITAEIDKFDVLHAAWMLFRTSKFYPSNTIFLAITNPGGSTKPPVLILTNNGHTYIGQDNGTFDLVVEKFGHKKSYIISKIEASEPKSILGSDYVVGMAAAKISKMIPIEKVGTPLKENGYKPKLAGVSHQVDNTRIIGTVMDIDRFGNATTNISESDLSQIGIKPDEFIQINLEKHSLKIPLKDSYGFVSDKKNVAIIEDGLLQLAINVGNFAKTYGISRGTEITVKSP